MAKRLSQGMPKLKQRRLAAAATKSTASASSLSNWAAPSSLARAVRYCSMLARNTCRASQLSQLRSRSTASGAVTCAGLCCCGRGTA